MGGIEDAKGTGIVSMRVGGVELLAVFCGCASATSCAARSRPSQRFRTLAALACFFSGAMRYESMESAAFFVFQRSDAIQRAVLRLPQGTAATGVANVIDDAAESNPFCQIGHKPNSTHP